MTKNNFFKILLLGQTIVLLIYTFIVFQKEDPNLFLVFITNIKSLNWNGQFNLDFSCYLMLSAFWIMWRNKFTFPSIIIGIVAMIVGIMVFAPYLLWLMIVEKGNLKTVIVGDR